MKFGWVQRHDLIEMNPLRALSFGICCLAASPAFAQDMAPREQAAEAPSGIVLEAVVVTGLKDPAKANYARLLQGVSTFHAKHGLAPDGTLLFEAIEPSLPTHPLILDLHAAERTTKIATDSMGRFTLPSVDAAGSDDGELVSNRRSGLLKIKPLVVSPGVPANARRLGDLRLQCEVLWTVEKHEVSLFVRGAFGVVGGPCSSSKAVPGFSVSRKLASAELVFGERKVLVRLSKNGLTYWPPLFDASWPDDALVMLTPAT